MSLELSQRRVFAIVPAAGRSRRMGRDKLVLPIAGRPVLEHVLAALQESGVDAVVVVIRPGDETLREIAHRCGAEVVIPAEPPEEMIVSVQHALRHLQRKHSPQARDAWLLALADQPTLSPTIVKQMLARWQTTSRSIVVPVYAGKRGHPVLFGWSRAADALAIPPSEGLNQLLRRNAADVEEVAVASTDILTDLDTPDQYERLRARTDRA